VSARVIILREDDNVIVEKAADLAIEATGRLLYDERHEAFSAQLRVLVPDDLPARRLEESVTYLLAVSMDQAAHIGFYLGLSLASHGPLGDRAWLAEALRLAGEDVTVEVRQAEG
jgi:hypothetical protein